MLLEEILNPQNILDYAFTIQQDPYFWESLFPARTIEGNKFEFISDEYDMGVTMARFHPLNSPTDLDKAGGLMVSTASIGYLKRERNLDEQDLLDLAAPRSDVAYNEALDNSFNHGAAMVRACQDRVEALRAEVATTGKLVINENGYRDQYDFGVPKENRKTLKWDDSFDILAEIMDICDAIENNGQNTRPAYMVVSSKTIKLLLNNQKLRSAMFGINEAIVPTQATLNSRLQEWGLPRLVRYNSKMRFPNANNTGYTTKRLMDENAVIFLPDGPIGETIFGTTPEEVNKRLQGVELARQNNIVLQVIPGHDMETQTIKASCRAFVTLKRPKQIVIGQINNG